MDWYLYATARIVNPNEFLKWATAKYPQSEYKSVDDFTSAHTWRVLAVNQEVKTLNIDDGKSYRHYEDVPMAMLRNVANEYFDWSTWTYRDKQS